MNCDTKNGLENVGGTILFLGDSITDQGHYISWLNSYFRLYLPQSPSLINLGVSSETCSGLSEPDHPFPRPCVFGRLEKALSYAKPQWVVLMYGINDGIYYPLSEERFRAYRQGIERLVELIQSHGAKAVVLTPPPFDSLSFLAAQDNPQMLPEGAEKNSYMEPYRDYHLVMEAYARWIMEEMPQKADKVVDIYTPLLMDRALRREAEPEYTDGDGIHPSVHGHWLIAKSLLKELFGIASQSFEAVMNGDSLTYFKLNYELDSLAHSRDKETVGHDNIWKNPLLKPNEYELKTEEINKKITDYPLAHNELLEQAESWQGLPAKRIHFEGYEGIIVEPENAAPARPWVWRTEFFGAFAQADKAMAELGWHVVHLAIPDRFGCPAAVETMGCFHTELVKRYKLNSACVLFGFSRGGLYATAYAHAFPERVAAMYLDAPVVDINIWPGRFKNEPELKKDWELCLKCYNYTKQQAEAYLNTAIAMAEDLAARGIPLILVAGDSDTVVPFAENGGILRDIWQREKAPFKLILKPGVGHHPHSLEDPREIVDFLRAL